MDTPQVQAYRRQQLEAASPGQLVLFVLEHAVRACRLQDRRRARRAVEELIGGLDLEQPEGAGGLLVLYDWVLRLLREGRFGEAEQILDELRGSWAQALTPQS